MEKTDLKANHWYWIRRRDGSLAPYRFHALASATDGQRDDQAEFFVGSFIQKYPLSSIAGEAVMPEFAQRES